MIKPEAKRIRISAVVQVLPLNPFIPSILSFDSNEKLIGYRQAALRADHCFARLFHC